MPAWYVHRKRRITENLQAEFAADFRLPETEYIVQSLAVEQWFRSLRDCASEIRLKPLRSWGFAGGLSVDAVCLVP
jgi:hypothetical protein